MRKRTLQSCIYDSYRLRRNCLGQTPTPHEELRLASEVLAGLTFPNPHKAMLLYNEDTRLWQGEAVVLGQALVHVFAAVGAQQMAGRNATIHDVLEAMDKVLEGRC